MKHLPPDQPYLLATSSILAQGPLCLQSIGGFE